MDRLASHLPFLGISMGRVVRMLIAARRQMMICGECSRQPWMRRRTIIQYEADSALRDTEQVPFLEDIGIEAFIGHEVLSYTRNTWINEDATRIGHDIRFTRHFYKPQSLSTPEEISAAILAQDKAPRLLDTLLTVGAQ